MLGLSEVGVAVSFFLGLGLKGGGVEGVEEVVVVVVVVVVLFAVFIFFLGFGLEGGVEGVAFTVPPAITNLFVTDC